MYKYGLCRKGVVNALRVINCGLIVTFPEKINILFLTQTKHNKLYNTRIVPIYVCTLLRESLLVKC